MAQAVASAAVCSQAIEAAKEGDQHRLRSYLDEQDGDVNLRDLDTQGTLLHVRRLARRQAHKLADSKIEDCKLEPQEVHFFLFFPISCSDRGGRGVFPSSLFAAALS